MPTASAEGCSLYYETAGAGETVAFVGAAGVGAWQWSTLYDELAGPREALVWDLRGTGRSDAPPGRYDVDAMAADLAVVLAAAGADRAHLVGAGLGGMVALRYARDYDRGRSLALVGTAPSGEAVDETALRALHPDAENTEPQRSALSRAVSPAVLAREDLVERVIEWRQAEDATGEALETQIAAMLAFEAGPLHEIGLPTLVPHGTEDPVVPPAAGEALARNLPRGTFVPLAGRHLAHFEGGPALADRLVGFLETVGGGRG
jgi:3-oxoadipate enol-lactonase